MKRDVTDLKQEMNQRFEGMEEKLLEAIRDSQTEILKAFFPFQEAISMRLGTQDTNIASVGARMVVVERRLFEIEKRLLMHPPAA